MSEVTDFAEDSKEQLVSDMKVVVSDAEEILRETKGVAGEKIAELRERFAVPLRDAKMRIADAVDRVLSRPDDNEEHARVKAFVKELSAEFPLYPEFVEPWPTV